MIRQLILGIFLLFASLSYSQSSEIDSLKNLLNLPRDTNTVLGMHKLGVKYFYSDIDSALLYLKIEAHLADSLDFSRGQISSYRTIGISSLAGGDYQEDLKWLSKGQELIDKKGLDIGNKVDYYINEAVIHNYAGNTEYAVEASLKAIEICRAHDLVARKGRVLNNLGPYYRKLKEYDKALLVYEDAYNLRMGLQDTLGAANVQYNMTSVYAKLDRKEDALKSLNKAIEFYQILGREDDLVDAQFAYASALLDLNQNKEARDVYRKLKEERHYNKPSQKKTQLHIGLASAYAQLGQYKSSLAELLVLSSEIDSINYKEAIVEYYKQRSDVYAALGNYDRAYEDLDKYQALFAESKEEDKQVLQEEMLAKYEAAEKDYDIDLLEKENALSELKIASQKARNWYLSLGLAGLALFSLWLYRLFKKVKLQNQIIAKSEQEKTVLLKEIHHRVKNNLQVISSLLNLQARRLEDGATKDALMASKSRVQSMSLLHQNLYRKDDVTNVNVKNYIKALTDNLLEIYNVEDDVKINLNVDDIIIDVDTLVPLGLILNELTCNALKYAFDGVENATININLNKDDDGITLGVDDNGIGLKDGKLPHKKGSLGVKLIESFTRRLEAKLVVLSQAGTSIKVIIPGK